MIACAPAVCTVATMVAERTDTVPARQTLPVRYALVQRTGLPGIDPAPSPFPPRSAAPID